MFTNYYENLILNHILGGAGSLSQATWYLALFTATPGETGGGTECSGGAYARKAITNNVTNFPTTSASTKSLGAAIAFDEATNNWGTITSWGLFDSSSGGNLCMYGALTTSVIINQGDIARVPVGSIGLALSLD